MPRRIFIWIFARLGLLEWYSHTFTKGLMSFHYLVIKHLAANTSKITPQIHLAYLPYMYSESNIDQCNKQTVDYRLFVTVCRNVTSEGCRHIFRDKLCHLKFPTEVMRQTVCTVTPNSFKTEMVIREVES